jgi:cell wall-associated NlpC family hydrolase
VVGADTDGMRPFVLACLLAFVALFPLRAAAAPAEPPPDPGPAAGWASAEIHTVVARGALARTVETFRPTDPLTRGDLYDALTTLGFRSQPPTEPDRFVVLTELDAKLVAALGLSEASRAIRLAIQDAGLAPTSYVGTETVARLLGLRINHPQGEEFLELGPREPATRAEAAFSLARALNVTDVQKVDVLRLTGALVLPALSGAQAAVLARAVRFVGYPYVWAGTSERVQELYTGIAPGGFDCSGLVWRVYKLQPFGGLPLLGASLVGRTTFSMAAERLKADRLPLTAVQPGDLLFFGTRGTASTPQEVGHMGIAVAPGWFLHSSGNGVTLQPLRGWYATRFAWARSPIREAGLA